MADAMALRHFLKHRILCDGWSKGMAPKRRERGYVIVWLFVKFVYLVSRTLKILPLQFCLVALLLGYAVDPNIVDKTYAAIVLCILSPSKIPWSCVFGALIQLFIVYFIKMKSRWISITKCIFLIIVRLAMRLLIYRVFFTVLASWRPIRVSCFLDPPIVKYLRIAHKINPKEQKAFLCCLGAILKLCKSWLSAMKDERGTKIAPTYDNL